MLNSSLAVTYIFSMVGMACICRIIIVVTRRDCFEKFEFLLMKTYTVVNNLFFNKIEIAFLLAYN